MKCRICSFKTHFMLSSKTFCIYEMRAKNFYLTSKGHKRSDGSEFGSHVYFLWHAKYFFFQLHQLPTFGNHKVSCKYPVFWFLLTNCKLGQQVSGAKQHQPLESSRNCLLQRDQGSSVIYIPSLEIGDSSWVDFQISSPLFKI